ncbi:MAG: 50S ribosomal protein L35ae [Candidatus Diapherotrites archaeon]|nr:50S ribosomal protein L35ae [Candidatus Diapherotrites archaeon]
MMAGRIKSFRRGIHTTTMNQLIVELGDITDKAHASKLVGRKAIWTTPSGKKIVGKVSAAHGSKGTVRVRFTQGMPVEALGTRILIQ